MTDLKTTAVARDGGRDIRDAQAGERAHTEYSEGADAKEALALGEQACREAYFFEAVVVVIRTLIRLAAINGLEIDRARFIVRLAARAVERRL